MKQLFGLLLATFLASAGQVASAFNYTDASLLLLLRGGSSANDVEFNLGSVSNYLGLANGTVKTVTNFDLAILTNNFNGELTGVKFALVAATSSSDSWLRLWASDSTLTAAPKFMSWGNWSAAQGAISAVGIRATQNSLSNATPSYVDAANASGTYEAIFSNNKGGAAVATLDGLLAFPAEGAIPGTLALYQLEPSNLTPKPVAPIVGSFTMEAKGTLSFRAGPVVVLSPSRILAIKRNGSQTTVSFATGVGVTYRLRYAPSLGEDWTTLPTSVIGDGNPKALADTTTDNLRFYQVVTSSN